MLAIWSQIDIYGVLTIHSILFPFEHTGEIQCNILFLLLAKDTQLQAELPIAGERRRADDCTESARDLVMPI